MSDRLEATLALDRPLTSIKDVGVARERVLSSRGMRTVRDLLSEFPYRYIDLTQVASIEGAPIGGACTIAGTIHETKLKFPQGKRLSVLEITLVDDTGTLIVTYFNQHWLMDEYKAGMRVSVAGKVEFNYGFKRMTHPLMERLDGEDSLPVGQVIPVYHASEKLKSGQLRQIVGNALEACWGMEDPLPLELRSRYRLMSRQSALSCIHRPQAMAEVADARRRLIYEELLFLELRLMMQAAEWAQGKHPATHIVDGPALEALEVALPFALTDEQVRAKDELLAQLGAEYQANHLLLGDVGTGKTVVAAFGLAAVADTGMQALMMAPTEVLALQYAKSLGPLLDAAGVSWAVLTGATPTAERAAITERVASGEIVVLFGTHVLLEADVAPPRVSLVVVDEQQRFGVEQRQALVAKGECPDILSMTATPIPRSLALAVYGDMTLSYLTRRPRNAAGSVTVVLDRERAGNAYDAALDACAQGRQVYVVCPLVGQPRKEQASAHKGDPLLEMEHDDNALAPNAVTIEGDADLVALDTHAAEDHARYLQERIFGAYRVGVLHGRLSSEQKQQVMEEFRSHKIDVLVATTVIEVGVDVPDATVMIIEDADRFGLAQLHQLRGRVGRGEEPGAVFLISDSRAPVAVKRLQAMESTQDGFALSEYDLSLRREGDILGNRQHGASTLRLVNIMRDKKVIEAAYTDARALLEADPELSGASHAALRRELRLADEEVQQ